MKKRAEKPNAKIKIIVVLGPTASGKSDLAVNIAERFGGEVVSADSRQVYRGLNLGSGKIAANKMRGVPHHLLDVASPKSIFTAARFQKLAEKAIAEITGRGKLPVVCGGTGLYIDALVGGWTIPEVPPRPELRKKLEQKTAEELFALLRRLDPRRAKNIDRFNRRRLVRALEIALTTGKAVPALRKTPPYNALKIGVAFPPEELKKRIRLRLRQRLRQRMIGEVKKLRRGGLSWKRLDDLGLEYRWISRYLRGFLAKKEMEETLEKEIVKYAKRQMTWFKRDREIVWFSPAEINPVRSKASNGVKKDKASRLVREFLRR